MAGACGMEDCFRALAGDDTRSLNAALKMPHGWSKLAGFGVAARRVTPRLTLRVGNRSEKRAARHRARGAISARFLALRTRPSVASKVCLVF